MKQAKIESITVENRQRSSMDKEKLQQLKNSIADKGLLHAPVVRMENSAIHLVAGERRLTAMHALHEEGTLFLHDGETVKPGYIPYITVQDLNEIQVREAELEENVLREDLTWQDKVSALDELHALRVAQNPAQTKTDTAQEILTARGAEPTALKHQVTSIGRAQLVAKFLDDPDVARAKTENEAFKIASTKLEAQFSSHAKPSQSAHILLGGEFAAMRDNLRGLRFSTIIADPPYGMGADSFGTAATMQHHYSDSAEVGLAISRSIIREGYNMTEMQAYLFLFCDVDLFLALREFAREIGWKPFRTPIIWEKGPKGHVPEGLTGFRRSYEMILAASKGNKKMGRVASDVISLPPEQTLSHAAQKPVELYKRLLSFVSIRGDLVLDPCCGSGTIFPAADELGLVGYGIEPDEASIQLAQGRINSLNE